MKLTAIFTSALLSIGCLSSSASINNFVINVGQPGASIPKTMYGIFFEDINYAADGGLYAELVKNRSFEFPQNMMGWDTFGNVSLRDDGPFERNPHYIRLGNPGHSQKHTGVANEGFFGIGVKKGKDYRFSVWARTLEEDKATLRVELADKSSKEENQALCMKDIVVEGKEWKKYSVILKPSATNGKAQLRIFLTSPKTTVDLEHISLFPSDTWNGHENGLRKDLVQRLADLEPGVFRFPGGCIVEGTDFATRYQWKNTIGPVENRPVNENRWHYTFTNRFFPDYFQTNGLGFYEYFLLSEELGSEPLPIINVGLACQFQNNADEQPGEEVIEQLVEDALDLVEFGNGNVDTEWGRKRAEMGHPEPFSLKFLGLGNEQWGPEYIERVEPFVKKIREKYPEIKLIGSAGPDSEGEKFDYLWEKMDSLSLDIVDEHFYRPESWFLSQGYRFDRYNRRGPKVFAGEYACHGEGKKYNHFNAALMEAAFMTGLERNSDIVEMATYAPLFAHTEGWQWRPDLIWFDNLESFPTSSYYVQQLYSKNRGSQVLPLTMNGKPVAGDTEHNGLYATASADKGGDLIIKIVNVSDKEQEIKMRFEGMDGRTLSGGIVTTLHSDDADSENSLDNPGLISPRTSEIEATGDILKTNVGPSTLAIYRLHTEFPSERR